LYSLRPKAALRAGTLFGTIHCIQDGCRNGRNALSKRVITRDLPVRRFDDYRAAQCSADALDVALIGPLRGFGWRRPVFASCDPCRVDLMRLRFRNEQLRVAGRTDEGSGTGVDPHALEIRATIIVAR
jgi:hypothetical protein